MYRPCLERKLYSFLTQKGAFFAFQKKIDEEPNHFKMAMSHVTEQFAEEWYNRIVDPSSKDRDPKHAKINRKHIPTIVKSFDRNKRPTFRVSFKHYPNGRFKLDKKQHTTIYQKKCKRVRLREHETLQDAEKHMYSDITTIYTLLLHHPSSESKSFKIKND